MRGAPDGPGRHRRRLLPDARRLTTPQVPAAESAITAAWVEHVLARSFPDIAVESVVRQHVGEAYGLASSLCRATLTGIGAPASVVVKMWPTASTAGDREVRFYEELAPAIGIRVPECHFAATDDNGGRGVLVLEDISPARQGDELERVDTADVAALASTYARLHATWMASPSLGAATWLPATTHASRTRHWYSSRTDEFLARFGPPADPFVAALVARAEAAGAIAAARLEPAPDTLLHRDLHLDNVLFADAGPVVLDWAGCARGPAALDLAALLVGIAEPDRYDIAIAAYRREYIAAGGTHLDTIVEQLGAAFLVQFIVRTLGVARWKPTGERGGLMLDHGLRQTYRAALAWRDRDPALFGEVL